MKLSVTLKLTAGFIALLFGAVGLLLPIWPTTPFVLVAVGCFSTTPKLQQKLLKIKFFNEYYYGYTSGRGLRRKTVAQSLIFLWAMLTLSCVIIAKPIIAILLPLIGIAVTIHILCIAKGKKN